MKTKASDKFVVSKKRCEDMQDFINESIDDAMYSLDVLLEDIVDESIMEDGKVDFNNVKIMSVIKRIIITKKELDNMRSLTSCFVSNIKPV